MKRKGIIIGIGMLLIGSAFFIYLYHHPLALKLLNGSARVLSPPLKTTIKVCGQIHTTAKCFTMKTLFDDQPVDNLVLWLPNASAYYKREILMINRREKLVGMPNASNLEYDLLLNIYLFQAESGSLFTPFSSVKWDNQDPMLEITDKTIQFTMPEGVGDFSSQRIEVVVH
jgi:hypothetical protein